jgi:hypothetical protein
MVDYKTLFKIITSFRSIYHNDINVMLWTKKIEKNFTDKNASTLLHIEQIKF